MKLFKQAFLAMTLISPVHGANDSVITFTGAIHHDNDTSSFLKLVLTSMNIPFTEKNTADGIYVKWKPNTSEIEQEISNRVSQYVFIKDVCKSIPLPSPSSPAKEKLSC